MAVKGVTLTQMLRAMMTTATLSLALTACAGGGDGSGAEIYTVDDFDVTRAGAPYTDLTAYADPLDVYAAIGEDRCEGPAQRGADNGLYVSCVHYADETAPLDIRLYASPEAARAAVQSAVDADALDRSAYRTGAWVIKSGEPGALGGFIAHFEGDD